jgi:predicted Zn-ribbon and HTH transcriptional regulator
LAAGRRFSCNACNYEIESWDDGNPYVVDAASGRKRYVYHPDPERNQAVGNDSPHLCLACGHEFSVDSREPTSKCPKCRSDQICRTWRLDGKPCPKCKRGTLVVDPTFFAIS